MTTWQWRVILALCRLVIDIVKENDLSVRPNDIYLLHDALKRGEIDE